MIRSCHDVILYILFLPKSGDTQLQCSIIWVHSCMVISQFSTVHISATAYRFCATAYHGVLTMSYPLIHPDISFCQFMLFTSLVCNTPYGAGYNLINMLNNKKQINFNWNKTMLEAQRWSKQWMNINKLIRWVWQL